MTARTDGTLQQALSKFWQNRFTTYTATQLNIPSPFGDVKAATTSMLNGTYVEPTITGTVASLGTIDGVVLNLGDRVVVKNFVTIGGGPGNGIYVVTTRTPTTLVYTRAPDANTGYKLSQGRTVRVKYGTTNANTNLQVSLTTNPPVLGITVIGFVSITTSPYQQRLNRARWESGRGKCRVVLRIRPNAPVVGATPYYVIEFYISGGWSGNPQADGRYAMYFLEGPVYSNDGATVITVEQITNYGAVIASPLTPTTSIPPYNTRIKIDIGMSATLPPSLTPIVLDLDFYPLDLVTPPNPFPPKYTIHDDAGLFPANYRIDLQIMNPTSTDQSGYIPLGNGHKSIATRFGWIHKTLTLTDTNLTIATFNPFELGLGRIRVNMKHRFLTPPANADPFYEIQFDLDGGYFTRTSQGGVPGRWTYWDVKGGISGVSVFSTDGLATVVRDTNNPILFYTMSSVLDGANSYTFLFQPYVDLRTNAISQPRFGITRTSGTFLIGDTLELTFIYFNP